MGDILPFERPVQPDIVAIERDGRLFKAGIRQPDGQYKPGSFIRRQAEFLEADVWAGSMAERHSPPLKIEYRFNGPINLPPEDPEAA